MVTDVKYCRHSPNYRDVYGYCDDLRYRIAIHFLFMSDGNEEERSKGLMLIKDLAERGHPDAMCCYGVCLNDGHGGNDPNPKQAVVCWRRCVDMYNHVQSMYELGVALYTGEGVVEDEVAAVKMFERAAVEGKHSGAAYILGDCLLDGVGADVDRGQALEWLVMAAELGHRGARSRVLAVLEKKEGEDYGRFTDASRQTLKVDASSDGDKSSKKVDAADVVVVTTTENKERKQQQRIDLTDFDPIEDEEEDVIVKLIPIERRYTIGGGSRNPVVLARRRTIIEESRNQ